MNREHVPMPLRAVMAHPAELMTRQQCGSRRSWRPVSGGKLAAHVQHTVDVAGECCRVCGWFGWVSPPQTFSSPPKSIKAGQKPGKPEKPFPRYRRTERRGHTPAQRGQLDRKGAIWEWRQTSFLGTDVTTPILATGVGRTSCRAMTRPRVVARVVRPSELLKIRSYATSARTSFCRASTTCQDAC
jgi:hypothetical protein